MKQHQDEYYREEFEALGCTARQIDRIQLVCRYAALVTVVITYGVAGSLFFWMLFTRLDSWWALVNAVGAAFCLARLYVNVSIFYHRHRKR